MKNEAYDELIYNEIVVDCYGDEEVAMGWYLYVGDTMHFPFKAKIHLSNQHRRQKKAKVMVVGLAPSCEGTLPLRVEVLHEGLIWEMDLLRLRKLKADAETLEVVDVYRYWVGG